MISVGLLTIGQSPRSDLTDPLRLLRPDIRLVEAGALDHLAATDLPAAAEAYPLKTRLRDGALVTVDQAFLAPHLQRALARLEAQDVAATLLLCAGTFAGLSGSRPLLKPFSLVQGMLQNAGIRHVGVVCPFAEQEEAIHARWLAAGFDVFTETASLADTSRIEALIAAWTHGPSPVECFVLDYVGHDPALVLAVQERCCLPVFDLGLTSMAVLAEMMPTAQS